MVNISVNVENEELLKPSRKKKKKNKRPPIDEDEVVIDSYAVRDTKIVEKIRANQKYIL